MLRLLNRPLPLWLAFVLALSGPVSAAGAVVFYGSIVLPPYTSGNPSGTSVSIFNDNQSTNGMKFNIPTSSSFGYSFAQNGSPFFTLIPSSSAFTGNASLRKGASGNLILSPDSTGGLFLGNDAASLSQIGFGPSSVWGTWTSSGLTANAVTSTGAFKASSTSTFTGTMMLPDSSTWSSSGLSTFLIAGGRAAGWFTNGGSALGATAHIVTGQCAISAGSCTVVLSGAAVFSSSGSYQVFASSENGFCNVGGPALVVAAIINSASQFTLNDVESSSSSGTLCPNADTGFYVAVGT